MHQTVYNSEKKVIKECESKTTYDLFLWLPAKFDVNANSKSLSRIRLYSAENIHGRVFFYWDYINRFMKYTPYFDVKNSDSDDQEEKDNDSSVIGRIFGWLLLPIAIPLLLLVIFSDVNELRAKLNPFKVKWPKAVHEWSGKVIKWY